MVSTRARKRATPEEAEDPPPPPPPPPPSVARSTSARSHNRAEPSTSTPEGIIIQPSRNARGSPGLVPGGHPGLRARTRHNRLGRSYTSRRGSFPMRSLTHEGDAESWVSVDRARLPSRANLAPTSELGNVARSLHLTGDRSPQLPSHHRPRSSPAYMYSRTA